MACKDLEGTWAVNHRIRLSKTLPETDKDI
jgi:hypothetical protein